VGVFLWKYKERLEMIKQDLPVLEARLSGVKKIEKEKSD